jgi:propionate CoA-transferase
MVRGLADRFYSGVSRYTTSGFLRIKLGEALEKRGVAAHIFESAEEAQSDWRNIAGIAGPDAIRPDQDRHAIPGGAL